jgi:hypothetical protein
MRYCVRDWPAPRLAGEPIEELDCLGALETQLGLPVDLTHASLADLVYQPIARDHQ